MTFLNYLNVLYRIVKKEKDLSSLSMGQIGSANLMVTLIKPHFVDKNGTQPQYLTLPFYDMVTSRGNDFVELLSAKGFTIRGYFCSRDEMVYCDKLSSSCALEINIDLNSSL